MKVESCPDGRERRRGALAHLAAALGLVLPLGSVAGPLLVGWLFRESDFVRRHASHAWRFQASVLLYEAALTGVVVGVVSLPAGAAEEALGQAAVLAGLLLLLALLGGVLLADVILVLRAARAAYNGVACSYPFTLRFFKA